MWKGLGDLWMIQVSRHCCVSKLWIEGYLQTTQLTLLYSSPSLLPTVTLHVTGVSLLCTAELTRKNLLYTDWPYWLKYLAGWVGKHLITHFKIPFQSVLANVTLVANCCSFVYHSVPLLPELPASFPHSHHLTLHLSYIPIKVDPDGPTISSLTLPPSRPPFFRTLWRSSAR